MSRLTIDRVRNLMCVNFRHITKEEAFAALIVKFPEETEHNIRRMIDVIDEIRTIASQAR